MKNYAVRFCLIGIVMSSKITLAQNTMDYCSVAIEMLNKNNIDSCDYYLGKAGYYSESYVNDKSDCFVPFNSAKEKKFLADLQKNPNDGNAAGSVAMADYWLKKYDESIKYYNLAITLDPNTAWYYSNLSYLYSSKLNNPTRAEETDDLFLKNNPSSDNYTDAGAKLVEKGNYKKAIVYFKKALDGGSYDYKAYSNIGLCFRFLKKCDSALYYCEKSLGMNSNYLFALNNLKDAYACSLDSLKNSPNLKSFVQVYDKYYEKFPQDVYKYTDYYNSIKDLAVRPSSDGYYKLGHYLFLKEDIDAAIPALKSAIKMDSKNADASYELGYVYLEYKKDYKNGIQLFNNAYSVTSSTYIQRECLYNIGLCYKKLGDNSNAIESFKKVLAKAPTDKDTHYNLYLLYEQIGDKANAAYHKMRSN